MTQGYIVEGTVSKWQYDDRTDATKYGNFYIKDSAGTEVLVYGATADATAMAFDSGTYKYTNRQDFLTNEFTKGVTINTKVRLAVLKTSYNGTVQFNAVVLAVNDTLVPNYVIDSGEVPSYQNNTYFLYEVTGTISAWQYDDRTDATKYGNFYLQTEESDPILIYGATASEGKITWGNGGLEFDNPQDFLTNAVTKDLDIGDTVTLRGIRADYNGTVELQGQIVVEVTEVGVSLDKDEAYLLPSETTNLKATVSGPEGTATTVTWASDHPEIATVDAEGKVTAVAAGTATITATSTADTTKKATATITVLDPSTAVTALKDVNVKDDKTVAKVRGVVDTINKSSAIINDGTGALLVYDGAFADAVKLGDYVEIYGTMDEYNNMAELLPVHYATLGADVTKPTVPAATPLTAEIVNAWDDEPATITPANVKRYSWTTTAAKDGNYWLLNIAGSDVKLEPYNIPDSISSKLKEGSTFNVEGYYLGWNAKNSYAQMAISSVTQVGGDPEPEPVDGLKITFDDAFNTGFTTISADGWSKTVEGIGIAVDKAQAKTAVALNDEGTALAYIPIRVYVGMTFTLSAPEGQTIKEISFEGEGKNIVDTEHATADKGVIAPNAWSSEEGVTSVTLTSIKKFHLASVVLVLE
ncbi:MAG TPA: Ig-like domain-containing protein [Candidatus Enterosoma merdigallinarum]|nr:Ig-like domain-containing protein [Candidatus Enterosoma merdigallinarum]